MCNRRVYYEYQDIDARMVDAEGIEDGVRYARTPTRTRPRRCHEGGDMRYPLFNPPYLVYVVPLYCTQLVFVNSVKPRHVA